MTRWVAKMPVAERDALSPLRLEPGVEALSFGDEVFIRGECESGTLPAQVRALPGTLYIALPDDQLIEYQRHTPTARIPIGHWSPLAQWLKVELPTAAFEAACPPPVALTLQRNNIPRGEANLLLADRDAWLRYAESAPATRLQRLRFTCKLPNSPQDSVTGDVALPQQVLIHGSPLPPIIGQRWVEQHGIATPAGWTWTPEIDADVVHAAFQLGAGDMVLLFPDGPSQRINRNHWSPAQRSAVRLNLTEESN